MGNIVCCELTEVGWRRHLDRFQSLSVMKSAGLVEIEKRGLNILLLLKLPVPEGVFSLR